MQQPPPPGEPPLSRKQKRARSAAARGFEPGSAKMEAAIARQQQPGWQKSQSKRLKKDKAELRARLHSEYDEQARTKQVPCTAPTQGYSPTPCLTVYVFLCVLCHRIVCTATRGQRPCHLSAGGTASAGKRSAREGPGCRSAGGWRGACQRTCLTQGSPQCNPEH